MTGVLIRREKVEHRERPRYAEKEGKGRDWRHDSQAKEDQGLPVTTRSKESRGTDSPSESLEGTSLSNSLISDFWLLEL